MLPSSYSEGGGPLPSRSPPTKGGDNSMSEVYKPQRFSPSDTISIDMEFQNESGVDRVYARFVNAEDLKSTIGLHGNGGGSTRLRISLQAQMATDPVPGEYLCHYI